MSAVGRIGRMVLQDLKRVWPLLSIRIAFAVLLRVSGLSGRPSRAFGHPYSAAALIQGGG